jgi:hypothetical protein
VGYDDSSTAIRRRDGGRWRSVAPYRDAGDPVAALGVGHVDREPVAVGLLERERHGDQPAVELGHGHLHGGVHGADRGVAGQPARPVAGQAQRLEHRDVQRRERPDVPGVVVATGRGVRRDGAAGGEHGHQQGVAAAQQVEQPVLRADGPQRAAVHR